MYLQVTECRGEWQRALYPGSEKLTCQSGGYMVPSISYGGRCDLDHWHSSIPIHPYIIATPIMVLTEDEARQPPTIQNLHHFLIQDNKVKVAGKSVLRSVKLSKVPRTQVSMVRTLICVPSPTDRCSSRWRPSRQIHGNHLAFTCCNRRNIICLVKTKVSERRIRRWVWFL